AIALALASLGIYGLLAYSVQNRTQEIGIRIALGAIPGELRNMVMLQGFRPALTGVVLGGMAALALTRFMESLLFDTKTWDPVAYGLVAVVFLGVTLVAAYLPARRATRIDPREALRYE
ncbi:MAG: FtsX-like permease family protein, partial [Terriglobales bacterium]